MIFVRLYRSFARILRTQISYGLYHPDMRHSSSSVFSSVFSPAAGKFVWKMRPDDYDYVQEMARWAYADMLHDYDRNEKYEEGVKSAIAEIRRRGLTPRVLDIGTGKMK